MWRLAKQTFLRFWAVVGVLSTLIGISGVPGDIQQWIIWINDMVDNPTVVMLAENIVRVAEFANQPFVRIGLVIFGLVLISWPLMWFWRLRTKFNLWWRSKVSEKVWISEQEAIEAIRSSDWGVLKAPHITEKRSILALSALAGISLNQEHTVSGLSEREKVRKKFDMFLRATLKSFQSSNPKATRQTEGSMAETELVALNAFLDAVIGSELTGDFGDVPVFKVT